MEQYKIDFESMEWEVPADACETSEGHGELIINLIYMW